jgi:hypothetical protein
LNVPFVNISVPGSGYNGIAVFDTGSPLFWMPEGTVFHGECPNPFVPTVATGAVPLNRNTSFAYGSGYMYGPVFNVRTPACTDSHGHTDLLLRGGVSGTALMALVQSTGWVHFHLRPPPPRTPPRRCLGRSPVLKHTTHAGVI